MSTHNMSSPCSLNCDSCLCLRQQPHCFRYSLMYSSKMWWLLLSIQWALKLWVSFRSPLCTLWKMILLFKVFLIFCYLLLSLKSPTIFFRSFYCCWLCGQDHGCLVNQTVFYLPRTILIILVTIFHDLLLRIRK